MNANRQKLEEMSDAEIDELFNKHDKVKVHVSFTDYSRGRVSISKDIYLSYVPVYGCHFEYEHGWGLHLMDNRTRLYITQSGIEVSAHVAFSDEEIISLLSLGWKKE